MRGDGTIYLRGRRWWIAYYRNGTQHRELGGTSKAEAKAKLKAVHQQLNQGTYLAPAERHVTVDDLLDDLVVYLKTKGRKSLPKVKSHLKPVRATFGHVRAVDLTSVMIERYQLQRLDAKKAPATVNRECEPLRQALRRAARTTPPRLQRAPYVPLLTVDNARQGFLQRADYEALAVNLPDLDVRDFVAWFWWTGMRPGEIRQLTWEMFNRETWTLNLDPKAAKTGRGREIAIVGPLLTIIERRITQRRLDCQLIFHRVSRGAKGQPVRDFSKQWRAALRAARLSPKLLPYDLRRSALRNMLRGGTHENVAMKISGHRTRSTFDRYNITSGADISAAITRTAAYVATLSTERNVVDLAATVEQAQNEHKAVPRRTAR